MPWRSPGGSHGPAALGQTMKPVFVVASYDSPSTWYCTLVRGHEQQLDRT